ncbi:MAG: AAA family ATPase [Candidatus Omnitrophica bacterium CG23_combo_of_CG06-09_8_20_14_all_41_10]|uniref:AAA family ATPase n=1 Tax=Candidatus Sherwoodlollariibacterium unditelluris TaxID=1974757 RepID=A0A2G9YL66_9BACT|nr:MAG: AAA family ATPase [Candidatus Omnitrophica bacterium CG23_combo_of_CG06-09_8_20_14_all_41_10]
MILRTIAKKLKGLALKFPVVSVVGPRQSGKTTLVKSVFPGLSYVSLEDVDAREFALKDPRGFLSTYDKGVIIDEVQRVPDLFSYIQTSVDAKKAPGRFILTGSQNILLHSHVSQTLAGRVAILKLLPLSFLELKAASFAPKTVNDCLFKGFYPRIFSEKIDPVEWYHYYIQTYVERDVRLIKNIGDLNTFQKFIKLCAGRIGQPLNLLSLGNESGITHNTAKAWVSILEASYIVYLLRPYHNNFNKRLAKMPKLYFYDTGLACSLLGIQDSSQLATHYARGNLFESLVITEMMKERLNQGLEPNCYYWKDKTGNEVDCIIDTPSALIPVEIKSGKTVTEDFFVGLNYWRKLAGQKDAPAKIVYGGDEGQKRAIADIVSWKNIPSIFQNIK